MDRTFLRDRTLSIGKRLLRRVERVVVWGSRVGNPPVFATDAFPWAKTLEAEWLLIRRELDDVLSTPEVLPPFQEISRDQRRLTNDNGWLTYFFYAFGYRGARNCDRCPETTRLIESIPGMTTAFFSILAPGKRLPRHRGTYKGVIRYHLGLRIPEPAEQCGIRVDDEVCHWQEGRSLIFDDTFMHEAWNDSDQVRVVLFVDVLRPLRFPANAINWLMITAIKHSPFVTDAIANYEAWEKKLEQPARPPASAGEDFGGPRPSRVPHH